MAGARVARESIRLIMWPAFRAAEPRVCPVCLTSVQDEDAVGLVGDRVGHAECVLVRWIGSGDELRDALSGGALGDALPAAGRSR
jgi:hypothetical protein